MVPLAPPWFRGTLPCPRFARVPMQHYNPRVLTVHVLRALKEKGEVKFEIENLAPQAIFFFKFGAAGENFFKFGAAGDFFFQI